MAGKKLQGIDPGILNRYIELISTQPDFAIKGATMPYTSMNGNMSSFLSQDGKLQIRLSKADKAAFITQYAAAETVQHGAVMKEYAEVPEAVWNDPAMLATWFGKSCDYARGLKAKAKK